MDKTFEELLYLNQEIEGIPNKLKRSELSQLICHGLNFYWREDKKMTDKIIKTVKYHINKIMNEK